MEGTVIRTKKNKEGDLGSLLAGISESLVSLSSSTDLAICAPLWLLVLM